MMKMKWNIIQELDHMTHTHKGRIVSSKKSNGPLHRSEMQTHFLCTKVTIRLQMMQTQLLAMISRRPRVTMSLLPRVMH